MRQFLIFICALFISFTSVAEKDAENNVEQITNSTNEVKSVLVTETPQVGKHVMANVDASSMILSLLMVLALIIISALVLKRFNITQQNTKQLKVVASLSLGAKERIVIVQVAEQQLVLGVTAKQITLIDQLSEPISAVCENTMPLSTGMAGNVLAFLQKGSINNKSTNANASTETPKEK